MKKFLLNKYTISCIIVLLLVAVDVVLHKGMSRVMMPASFTQQRSAKSFPICEQALISTDKKWVKAVNTTAKLLSLDSNTAGVEMDVYFDTIANTLFVYHDSSVISSTGIESILNVWASKKMQGSIWLDFKNLSLSNKRSALLYITSLRERFGLANKLIVESSDPASLDVFCRQGFFTSYYVPFFNPYSMSEDDLLRTIDEIAQQLNQHKVSALSGYYFQYPFLKKYFPEFPILTWTDYSAVSMVSNIFSSSLLNDAQIKVVLYPQ